MWIVLDLIVVAIIAFFALISAKKGFVRTLVEVVGFIAVILLANNVSPMLSETTYNKFIEPTVVEKVTESLGELDVLQMSQVEINQESIPSFVYKILGEDFSLENFQATINENLGNGIENAMSEASQTVIKPVITEILNVIFVILIVTVLSVAVKFLAKFLNKLFSFSFVGKANKVLGAVLGTVKGIAIAVIFCSVVALIVPLTENGLLIFTESAINSTILFKLLTLSI
ncbi:MAG: CvpA family protein [Clostridia bacterium]|nr:CvpA family protein [Clostridia bacterium]